MFWKKTILPKETRDKELESAICVMKHILDQGIHRGKNSPMPYTARVGLAKMLRECSDTIYIMIKQSKYDTDFEEEIRKEAEYYQPGLRSLPHNYLLQNLEKYLPDTKDMTEAEAKKFLRKKL
jgi:hypothetical protein